MASKLFLKLEHEAYDREVVHLRACQQLWVALNLTNILDCSRMVKELDELHDEFLAQLEEVVNNNDMRVRDVCENCGNPDCPGFTILTLDGTPPSSDLVNFVKKFMNKLF